MKTWIFISSSAVLLLIIVFLSVHIAIREQDPICDRIHLDDNLQLWGREDAVPDEETAKRIADIIIEAQEGFGLKALYPSFEYEIIVKYNDRYNQWELYYSPGPSAGGGIIINIRKDCGMITGLTFTA